MAKMKLEVIMRRIVHDYYTVEVEEDLADDDDTIFELVDNLEPTRTETDDVEFVSSCELNPDGTYYKGEPA